MTSETEVASESTLFASTVGAAPMNMRTVTLLVVPVLMF